MYITILDFSAYDNTKQNNRGSWEYCVEIKSLMESRLRTNWWFFFLLKNWNDVTLADGKIVSFPNTIAVRDIFILYRNYVINIDLWLYSAVRQNIMIMIILILFRWSYAITISSNTRLACPIKYVKLA